MKDKRNEINYMRKNVLYRNKRKLLVKLRNKRSIKRDAGEPKENISQTDMLRKEDDIKINCLRK